MANKYRGEKIFIFGERAWRFRANLHNIAEFEGESGLTLSQIVENIQNGSLSDATYLALEHAIRRNLGLEEPLSKREFRSFKKQIRELLLEIFFELNPKSDLDFAIKEDSPDIPWSELMYIFGYYFNMPFERFWNLSLPETKILLQGLSGGIYSKISAAEIKEMKEILKLA